MRVTLLLVVVAGLAPLRGTAQIACNTRVAFGAPDHPDVLAVRRTPSGVLIPIRLSGHSDLLWFLFDTGAGHTVLARSTAQRFELRPTSAGSLSGVGVGRVPVDIVSGVSLSLGQVRIEGVDLYVTDLPGSTSADAHDPDGILGYDLLCRTVVTLDYAALRLTVASPSTFKLPTDGDVLPLTIRHRWPFVQGTIKVPGNPAVTDTFLIDTGSLDAVNHPIIRQSTGSLRHTQTGRGGFGAAVPGVIGANEWFRLGRTTIPSTVSVCCAGNPEADRQLGEGILSHFRITFDYPHARLILED